MLEFCSLAYPFLDEVEDDDVNKDVTTEYSEETDRCAVLIAACKLISSDVVQKVNYYLFLVMKCQILGKNIFLTSEIYFDTKIYAITNAGLSCS